MACSSRLNIKPRSMSSTYHEEVTPTTRLLVKCHTQLFARRGRLSGSCSRKLWISTLHDKHIQLTYMLATRIDGWGLLHRRRPRNWRRAMRNLLTIFCTLNLSLLVADYYSKNRAFSLYVRGISIIPHRSQGKTAYSGHWLLTRLETVARVRSLCLFFRDWDFWTLVASKSFWGVQALVLSALGSLCNHEELTFRNLKPIY